MFSWHSLSQNFYQLAASSHPTPVAAVFLCGNSNVMSSKIPLCRFPSSEIPQLHLRVQTRWAGIWVRGSTTWTSLSSKSRRIIWWVWDVSSPGFLAMDYDIWHIWFGFFYSTLASHHAGTHALDHTCTNLIVGCTCVPAAHLVVLKMHALNISHVNICVISTGARLEHSSGPQ